MPRPTNEVPLFWCPPSEDTKPAQQGLSKLIKTTPGPSVDLVDIPPPDEEQEGIRVVNVRTVVVDTSLPSADPRGIDTLDLHSLVELHHQLEEATAGIPGELVLPGKVAGINVDIGMLVDTGASISAVSTSIWRIIRSLCSRHTLLPTRTEVRTVSGEQATVRGQVALEVKLGGQFYVHQFVVMDISEDIILGMDFLLKHQVDIDWRRGILSLRGEEVQSYHRYSLGNGRVRRIVVARDTTVPANSQRVVDGSLCGRSRGELPDWGIVSTAGKLLGSKGVMVGRTLIDPRRKLLPILVLNPGDTEVELNKNTCLGVLSPALEVGSPLGGGTLQPGQQEHQTMRQAAEAPQPPSTPPDGEEGDEVEDMTKRQAKRFFEHHWSDSSDSEDEGERPSDPCLETEAERVPPHLRKLYQDSCAGLTSTDCRLLVQFLNKNADVFATSSDDLGRATKVQHTIDTGEHRPIKQHPRRVPLHRKAIVQDEVKKMLERDVIEPGDGPWASPIVLATKKDGTTRFCVDYRRVNEVTKKDAYPLPRIDDNLDALQGAEFYSTLDLLSGFWQVEVAPEDRDKTAFCVGGGGLYRFLTMPFGLCNAPATFQRLMEQVLQGLQWEIAVLYIDDIIVFANTVEENLERMSRVFDRLRTAGLKLKPAKCELLRRRVPFLGHIVSAQGVEVDPSKIDRIVDWPTPTSLTQLRSFVGLCAYYRRYVPDFSNICKPLFILTQKGQPFVWGPAQQGAMDAMKELLTTAPILGYPKQDAPFVLDCDASNSGVGAVLSQVQGGEERVIAYGSKVLSKAERNYCVTRRELLAIITFVKQYHHYLYGSRFLVRTDHAALYWLLRKKDPEGQMARWIAALQAYDMVIQHRPGRKHGNADALSRCMEGCRETDEIRLTEGETCSLQELQQRARAAMCRVTTRSQAKQGAQEQEPGAHGREGSNPPVPSTPPKAGPPPRDQEHPLAPAAKPEENPGLRPSKGADEKAVTSAPQSKLGLSKIAPANNPPVAQPPGLGRSKGADEKTVTSAPQPKLRPSKSTSAKDTPSAGSPTARRDTSPDPEADPNPQPGYRPPDRARRKGVPARKDPAEAKDVEEQARLERQEQFFREQKPDKWRDEALAHLQDEDQNMALVKGWLRDGHSPTWEELAKESAIVKTWWARQEQLFLSNNQVLYLRWEGADERHPPKYRVAAVAAMFKSILTELHDVATAGHLGQKKTIARAKTSRFYWPGMTQFARRWVANCPLCASRKHPQYSKRTPLGTYRVGAPMERVSIDLVGPFHPRTTRGNSIILTVTDQYTRWAEAYALRDATAPLIARKVEDFCCRFGMPLELHSDRGRNVDGQVIREVCQILGIRKTHTTAYHPQGNSITERENGTIKSMLSAYTNDRQTDWDVHLNKVMLAFRSSVHRTLGETPNAMMLGREVNLPLDSMVGQPPEAQYQEMPATEYAEQLAEAMAQAHATVRKHVDQQYRYQKKQYDRKVRSQTFQEGQAVWLREYTHTPGKSKSLKRPYSGPWIVTARFSNATYKIQKSKLSKAQVVHSDRLKAYFGPVEAAGALTLWKPETQHPPDPRA